MPFSFVENRGQFEPAVRYTGNGPEFKAWFEDRAVILQQGRTSVRIAFQTNVDPAGMHPVPSRIRIIAGDPLAARVNYIRGTNQRQWKTDLPLFGSIQYTGIWPGVELTYRAEETRMKAEYAIAAGSSVDEVRLRFGGDAEIQTDGALKISGASGDFVEERPLLYQSIRGERREISGGFRKAADGSIGFWTGEYDKTEALVIDPAILFSGYFGGSSQESITAITIDSQSNVIVAGWSSSTDLPASNGFRIHNGGGVDAFVASFLPNGGALQYCTYLGGVGDDRAFGLAVDAGRNVYITGWTSSTNFPLAGAFQRRLSGTRDSFVTKLSASGNALIYSTYLGGTGVDTGNAITVDSTGAALIIGDTSSSNLPIIQAIQGKLAGGQDVFVARLNPDGKTLSFLTYLGGIGLDHGSSIRVGPSGGIFIGGYTWSNNFPTVLPYQAKSGGGQDGFIAKISFDGTKLKFSSYLGGYGGSIGAPEAVNAVFVDSVGNILVAGTTSSGNFPITAGAYQTVFGGQTDGFIARFSTSWQLLQSTFLGGTLADGISAIAVDFHGNPYVTGFTTSQDFPVQRPLQNTNAGLMDAFVVKFNPTLSNALFGTYLGGSGSDSGNAIAVDGQTSIFVSGQTSSGDFPVTGNGQNSMPSVLSSFVSKIGASFSMGVAYGVQGQMFFTADPWHVATYTQTALFGNATDLPVVGDWDGTGKKRIGVFRNGTWILDMAGNGIMDASNKTVSFGQAGDIPIVGDWRGTGRIALGLFRQGVFILDLSGHLTGVPTGQSDAVFTFGQGGDIPIAADWSGSGTAKVGVFRNGLWLVDYNGDHVYNNLDRSYVYGQAGDIPVVGDWDSSGNPSKIGVFRGGLWLLDYDGDNAWTVPYVNEMALGFGFPGQVPLVF
jgi:hypothetical protein